MTGDRPRVSVIIPARDCAAFLPEAVESVERRMIYDALKKTKHVKARAARLLGITERMLTYKMGKWNVDLRT